MKIKFYKNLNNSTIVYEEEAKEYVLEKLGISIIPKGKNGELEKEQVEFEETLIDWYFSRKLGRKMGRGRLIWKNTSMKI